MVASDAEGIEESGCVKLSIREGGALKEDFIYKLKQGFGEGDRQAKFVGAPDQKVGTESESLEKGSVCQLLGLLNIRIH